MSLNLAPKKAVLGVVEYLIEGGNTPPLLTNIKTMKKEIDIDFNKLGNLSKFHVQMFRSACILGLQQMYANASETTLCLGHKKGDRNQALMEKYSEWLERLDAKENPKIKGQYNGVGAS